MPHKIRLGVLLNCKRLGVMKKSHKVCSRVDKVDTLGVNRAMCFIIHVNMRIIFN